MDSESALSRRPSLLSLQTLVAIKLAGEGETPLTDFERETLQGGVRLEIKLPKLSAKHLLEALDVTGSDAVVRQLQTYEAWASEDAKRLVHDLLVAALYKVIAVRG